MATVPIDAQYFRTREQLLPYEDARFNSLIAGVPNSYSPSNDYSVWGGFLRAIAMELARFEFMYSYDIASQDPQYLTPPDIRRRFAGPLFISKSYPQATQSDQSYRTMVVSLIKAYQEGATVQALQDVITAYTGDIIQVQEIYSLVGNGFYTLKDHNTLKVSLNISGSDPSEVLPTVAEIQTISQNLYNALDLAKPAHIGLNYSIVLGLNEDLSMYTRALLVTASAWAQMAAADQAYYIPEYDASASIPGQPAVLSTGQYEEANLTSLVTAAQWAALDPSLQGWYYQEYDLNAGATGTAILTPSEWAILSTEQQADYTLMYRVGYLPMYRLIQVEPTTLTPAQWADLNAANPTMAAAYYAQYVLSSNATGIAPVLTAAQFAAASGPTQANYTEVMQLGAVNGILDTFQPIFLGVEPPPLPPIFTDAPLLNPNSPDTQLTAIGKLVGEYFAQNITADQYAALMSDDYRAEYAQNTDGSYTLLPGALNDVAITDSSNNPTGVISRAVGVLAPQEDLAWIPQSDSVRIYELD
jgi:hypothetical protein